MARPTIASLQREVDTLKSQKARVEAYLQDVDLEAYYIDKEDIVEQVAGILDIDVSQYRDVVWNIIVRGSVKVGKDAELSDLELTVRGLTVACANMGVDGYDYEGMEIEVEDVRFAW